MSSENNATAIDAMLVVTPQSLKADAGQAVTLHVECTVPAGFDPQGLEIIVLDPPEAEVARAPIYPAPDGGLETEITLTTPLQTGVTKFAVLLTAESNDALARGEVEITTRAHRIQLSAWDAPTTVTPGAHFETHIGLVCSSNCKLDGQEVRVIDPNGAIAGAGHVGGDLWPGTTALHFAQVTISAPAETGLAHFKVVTDSDDNAPPHDAGEANFAVHVMPEGSCDIRVEVLAADDETPLANAQVVLHPYRAVTDEQGSARLIVVPGTYRLMPSRKGHMPSVEQIKVSDDASILRLLASAPGVRQPEDDY